MKFFFKSAALIIFMGISMIFSSCSDESKNEELIVKYSYKLNYQPNGSSTVYHRVNEFHCTDNYNDTYNVKKTIVHYFSADNSKYKNLSGTELIGIANAKNIQPDGTYKYNLKSDTTHTVTSTSTTYYYYLPEGLQYEAWYYY